MDKAIEVLEEKISDLEQKLYKLECLEKKRECEQNWGWTRHRVFPEMDGVCPVPRIHLIQEDLSKKYHCSTKATVFLVIMDCPIDGGEVYIPLAEVRSGGDLACERAAIFAKEMKETLNLPATLSIFREDGRKIDDDIN